VIKRSFRTVFRTVPFLTKQMHRGGAAAPPLLTEMACTATLFVVAFLFFRWWRRDAAYTRHQQERDEHYQTTRDATAPRDLLRPARALPRSSAASQAPQGGTRAALSQRSSALAPVPPLQTAPGQDRRARKERLAARASQLITLLEQTGAQQDPSARQQGEPRADQCAHARPLVSAVGRHSVVGWPESLPSPEPHYLPSPEPHLLANDFSPDYLARPSPVGRSGSFGRTGSVSGASRYTAQLIKKRRASTEAA
jgi:hypothetical protein